MGHRADLILVEGREYQLFCSHWRGEHAALGFVLGIYAYAAAFIRLQRPVDVSGWLDEVWAEGGALLDLDEKHLLLFGGEDLLYDVPLRRVYLELLAQVWKGWTVRWAYEGIADLADYVGYPRDRGLTKEAQHSTEVALTPPAEMDWADLVASVRFDDDGPSACFPLMGDVASYLSSGSKFADKPSHS